MDDVIRLFNTHQVRYLIIGGQAVRLAGMPRFTMDWDFYIPAGDAANIEKINRVLEDQLDSPLLPLGSRGENFIQTYQTRSGVLQFHLGGVGLPKFDDAEKRAVARSTEQGTPVRCLSDDDLVAAKKKAGRPQDLQDAEFLAKKKLHARP